ncbi:MAG: UDP-N-acetylmuramoyl-tripeptide--D-alanyl-D-alanine ligase [Anaerolineae bacterium]
MILLTLLTAIIWIIVILRRVYRLARFFQLEGYEVKRFIRWFRRTPREIRYTLASAVALFVITQAYAVSLPSDSRPTILTLIGLAAAVGMLLIHPRSKQMKQPFNRTPRAMRLLVVGAILSLILPVLGILYLFLAFLSVGSGFGEAEAAFLVGTVGALPLMISLVWLPLANLLLFPYEESRRRYFMRRAKQTLLASGATVIAITGSYGKTSTKHYLQHILSIRHRTFMTPKSFNTLMGISRTINDTYARDPHYDYFIAEADAYFVGENASICRLVEPKIGMVMTVGPMHLERLGSMENIAKAQYEIVESLPADGAAFFNGDDPEVLAMAKRGYPQTRVIVSQKGLPEAQVQARNIKLSAQGLQFECYDTRTGLSEIFDAPLYGEANITNILMAAAVAIHLGLTLEQIAAQVSTLQPADHRMVRRVLPNGTVIIDDAYSANPVGTAAALGVLALHTESQHRVVISSGMFELGERAEMENRLLGERMASAATDIVLIGAKQTAPVKVGALSKGFPEDRLHTVETLNEAVQVYQGILGPGDALLVLTDLPDTYAG